MMKKFPVTLRNNGKEIRGPKPKQITKTKVFIYDPEAFSHTVEEQIEEFFNDNHSAEFLGVLPIDYSLNNYLLKAQIFYKEVLNHV